MYVRKVLALLVGLAAALNLGSAAAQQSKPNIVLIVGDDMGYADIGVHGCQDIPTPHLDALAGAGVRCTNGYVSGPYCSPTRAGMLTGRYQQRFGHEFNPGGAGRQPGVTPGLPLTETTFADRLRAAGYTTGLVGKWHLGGTPEMHPLKRGFDHFFGFLGGAHSYRPGSKPLIVRGTEPIDEKEYLTDALGREAVAFIEQHREEPFFLYLAFNAVHTPMEATDDRLEKFKDIADEKRRTYAAMMSAMDDNIGKVLAKLRDAGLEQNTLVFFISDNGGPRMRGTTVNGSNNAPLRGSKRTTLEGGVRVPFLVKWPAKLPAGKTYDQPVIQLDFLPTALAAAGVETQPEWKLEGVDLAPFLTGENDQPPHDALYWKLGQQMAVRQGDWKLVRYDPQVDGERGQPRELRLYNLADDIGEAQDLKDSHPEKAAALEKLWNTWHESNVRPAWRDGKGAKQGRRGQRAARRAKRAAAEAAPATE
jgi:arylsulfatase A-like enzyme